MFHHLSNTIADICVSRNWIASERRQWCVYALETKIQAGLLFLVIMGIAILTGVLPQTSVYSLVFFLLRKRFGGWHAPNEWLCQLISIALVFFMVLLVVPMILNLSLIEIWILNGIAIALAVAIKPVYPLKVHFSYKIVLANQRIKNMLLICIVIVQVCTFQKNISILVCSMLAIYTGIISVLIEYTQQIIFERKDQCESD